jgi:hypothetical protein
MNTSVEPSIVDVSKYLGVQNIRWRVGGVTVSVTSQEDVTFRSDFG